jgi:hypothetical protein
MSARLKIVVIWVLHTDLKVDYDPVAHRHLGDVNR